MNEFILYLLAFIGFVGVKLMLLDWFTK